jgi:uncharacterized protein GlcG (DUF336 family)
MGWFTNKSSQRLRPGPVARLRGLEPLERRDCQATGAFEFSVPWCVPADGEFEDGGEQEPPPAPVIDAAQAVLTDGEVDVLLRRAAAASASNDAIIAVVDRNGRILGVRTESGIDTSDLHKLVFSIDGAVAKARTAAMFANDAAPLTSRTIRNLSQSTITQREVEAVPTLPNRRTTTRSIRRKPFRRHSVRDSSRRLASVDTFRKASCIRRLSTCSGSNTRTGTA